MRMTDDSTLLSSPSVITFGCDGQIDRAWLRCSRSPCLVLSLIYGTPASESQLSERRGDVGKQMDEIDYDSSFLAHVSSVPLSPLLYAACLSFHVVNWILIPWTRSILESLRARPSMAPLSLAVSAQAARTSYSREGATHVVVVVVRLSSGQTWVPGEPGR
jgi:hypothetical protein